MKETYKVWVTSPLSGEGVVRVQAGSPEEAVALVEQMDFKPKVKVLTDPMPSVESPDPVFVAIGSYSWGKGKTVSEAVKECRKNLDSGKHKVLVFRVVQFNYVTDMGAINYGKDGSCEQVDEQTVTKRGF